MMDRPLFQEYGSYHTDPRNRACHEIGIPLIVLGIIALLRLVAFGPIDLAEVAIVALAVYYVRIGGPQALVAVAGLVVLYVIAMLWVTWPLAIAAFVVGWIFQFVGHAFEGKSPAFLTNLVHLLVGPLWVAGLLTTRRRAA